jgi:predicted 2-oxoglutarate/Fe(II)-dependent dioxygenase YbiX
MIDKDKGETLYDRGLAISWENIPEKQIIQNSLWYAINQYITIDNNNLKDWYYGWNGYKDIRFNRYDQNTNMRTHYDLVQDVTHVLSMVGQLNDDFEGGELIFWPNTSEEEKIRMNAGSLIVFPSTFLYPHVVGKILSGKRYSFVSYVW